MQELLTHIMHNIRMLPYYTLHGLHNYYFWYIIRFNPYICTKYIPTNALICLLLNILLTITMASYFFFSCKTFQWPYFTHVNFLLQLFYFPHIYLGYNIENDSCFVYSDTILRFGVIIIKFEENILMNYIITNSNF